MKQIYLTLIAVAFFATATHAQDRISPCAETEILKRHEAFNPNADIEIQKNEAFTRTFVAELVKQRVQNKAPRRASIITIPVVLHVFHNGDDGKIDLAQAQSGLDVLNRDFNGLNADFDSIDPRFDSIKATLEIHFCLATRDPNGNATSGVNYYQDSLGMLNQGNLFQHAWDNYKYLNIYLPKYTEGKPDIFTAYAYYPSTPRSNANVDGVFYSSIRWGFGSHSEFTPGKEWASVGTHELGHWLNLRHTFQNGCDPTNDFVDDTPPTLGGTIHLSGCYNNDSSCGVSTNGSNYMDYNHDCKKMFTQGQVDRMNAALNLPSRSSLWSDSNLIAAGCAFPANDRKVANHRSIGVYPNPAQNRIQFTFEQQPKHLAIYDLYGKLVSSNVLETLHYSFNVSDLASGVYFYYAKVDDAILKGKFVVNHK